MFPRMNFWKHNNMITGKEKTSLCDHVENENDTEECDSSNETTHFLQTWIRGPLSHQVFAAISISLGSMTIGFTSAYTSPAQVSMQKPESHLHVTDQENSWIGSLMPLSALWGGILGGTLIEKLGRKTTLVGIGIPFVIGKKLTSQCCFQKTILAWMLIAFAQDVLMIYAGRTIGGICVGIASLATPVYLAETIQPNIRGTLGLLPPVVGNIGVLLCFLIGSYVEWTWLAFIGGIIPIPFFICLFFIEETPRWYVSKGKLKEALKSLRWFRPSNSKILLELSDIEIGSRETEKQKMSLKDFIDPVNVKALIISLGLMFFQQCSGINAVIFYTVSIFKSAGSTINENVATIIVGVVNLGSTFLATVLIDRLGRKKLLYISDIFMTISLAVLGTFFYLKDIQNNPSVSSVGWLPLTCFIIFVIAFSLGFGPIPWLMMGEIFPTRIRGAAASITTAFNWMFTFIITKTFDDITMNLGKHGAFWLFSTICIIGIIFVILFVPETKGKSLEEIERELRTKHSNFIFFTNNMKNSIEDKTDII